MEIRESLGRLRPKPADNANMEHRTKNDTSLVNVTCHLSRVQLYHIDTGYA